MLLRKYLLQNALQIVHDIITTTTTEGTKEQGEKEDEK